MFHMPDCNLKVQEFTLIVKVIVNISMGIWQGVAMDSPKFHPGLPCLTLLHLADRPPLKQPHGCFRVGLPKG
jgi:hypothetical protein